MFEPEYYTLPVFYSRERSSQSKLFTLADIEFIKHNLISIKGEIFHIQFYAPTWTYYSKEEACKAWNRACGKVRTKRYIHLNKRTSVKDKIEYLRLIFEQDGCYIIKKGI